jgi:hypothetical protein
MVWYRRTHHLGALLAHVPLHRHGHGPSVWAHAGTGDTLAPRRLAGVMLMTVGHAIVLVRLGLGLVYRLATYDCYSEGDHSDIRGSGEGRKGEGTRSTWILTRG